MLSSTHLLLGIAALSILSAVPIYADEPAPIPVDSVKPLEIPTGSVNDLEVITDSSVSQWYWDEQRRLGESNLSIDLQRSQPDSLNLEGIDLSDVNFNRTFKEAEWGNQGEKRRRSTTVDLTEFQ